MLRSSSPSIDPSPPFSCWPKPMENGRAVRWVQALLCNQSKLFGTLCSSAEQARLTSMSMLHCCTVCISLHRADFTCGIGQSIGSGCFHFPVEDTASTLRAMAVCREMGHGQVPCRRQEAKPSCRMALIRGSVHAMLLTRCLQPSLKAHR